MSAAEEKGENKFEDAGEGVEESKEVKDSKEEELPNPGFRLEILSTIKTTQQQNGLRHDDHLRYRQYCSRRLRRLYKALKFLHAKHHFKVKVLEPKHVVEPKWFMIPLVRAERAWSYAMQLKNDMETQDAPRKRLHLIGRLGKAVKHAEHLVQLCHARADTRTQIEAEAYSRWMKGNYMLQRDNHSEALHHYLEAKNLLENLAKTGPELEAICEERLAQLEPTIRYCRYVLKPKDGRSAAPDSDLLNEAMAEADDILRAKLEHLLEESHKEKAKTLETVEWQGKTIPVRNDKLKILFIEASDAAKQLSRASASKPETKAAEASMNAEADGDGDEAEGEVEVGDKRKLALFGKAVASYDNALNVIRTELKTLTQGAAASAKTEEFKTALISLQAYAQFQKELFSLERNVLTVNALRDKMRQFEKAGRALSRRSTKPDEIVNIYERIIQNLADMAEAGNASRDANLGQALEARAQTYKALRVFYLAACYKRIGKFAEAAGLYGRAKELGSQALKAQQALPEKNEAEMEQLEEILKEVPLQLITVQACAVLGVDEFTWLAQLQQQQQPGEKKVAKELLDRLDAFDSGSADQHHNLVQFPPALQSTPCKPVLFDLAFNYLEMPDLSQRIAEAKAKEGARPQTRGAAKPKAAAPAAAPSPAPAASAPAKQPVAAPEAPKEEQAQEKRGGFLSRWWGGGR